MVFPLCFPDLIEEMEDLEDCIDKYLALLHSRLRETCSSYFVGITKHIESKIPCLSFPPLDVLIGERDIDSNISMNVGD